MIPSAEAQLKFLNKIQLLLEEGSFSSTYKFALLLAISDLAVERGDRQGGCLTLSVESLAKKYIYYYWRQAVPYPSLNTDKEVLIQNAGKQAGIISMLTQFQYENKHPLHHAINAPALIKQVSKVVREMPLWRLQNFPAGVDDFIYEQKASGSEITLREGVVYCFRVFHGHVQNMVQGAWVKWVRSLKQNNAVLSQLTDLNEFMFGSERSDLSAYVPLLVELQSNTCFYCDKALKGDKPEVDHFIPWSRYPVDLGHNFVLAHSTCNRDKRDFLPAINHLENWLQRNDQKMSLLNDYFEANNLMYDLSTSLSITHWAYDKHESIGGDVWSGKKGNLTSLDDSWRMLFNH